MKLSSILFYIVCMFSLASVALGQSNDILDRSNREPLRGISHVFLSPVSADPDIVRDGLNLDAIKTSVENKLRIAGLKIEPAKSMFLTSFETRPQMILINIEALKIQGEGIYCYTVRFEVTNYATLVQDKSVSRGFTIWEQHALGYAGTSRLSVVKDSCDNFTDKFVNDWLKSKDEMTHIGSATH